MAKTPQVEANFRYRRLKPDILLDGTERDNRRRDGLVENGLAYGFLKF